MFFWVVEPLVKECHVMRNKQKQGFYAENITLPEFMEILCIFVKYLFCHLYKKLHYEKQSIFLHVHSNLVSFYY